jgi:SAM-dependent methyltransferase
MSSARPSFFAATADEDRLEADNAAFWEALLAHIDRDYAGKSLTRVLDVGCHYGGLLMRAAMRFGATGLVGIEPLVQARDIAAKRLREISSDVQICDPSHWSDVEQDSIDLILCHEVLYLIRDVDAVMQCFHRVLKPGAAAYVVLGCHAENPVWNEWRQLIEGDGHVTFSHHPLDILGKANAAKLSGAIRPLRDNGWITYDPSAARFKFTSASAIFEHHYRMKLLFRFLK